MIKKVVWVGLTLSVLGFMSTAAVRADEWDEKTVLTFSQPVEIPGHVLPAGTYTFKLVDTLGDRHIVQVFNADGSQIIATVMAIPDYRLRTTDQTVIKFREVPSGAPEAIRAWFYPGNSVGQEFVYPKERATQLAKASKAVVPAVAADVADVDALKAAPIVAITPDAKEVPLSAAIQTAPVDSAASVATVPNGSSSVVGTTGSTAQAVRNATATRQLPKTASTWPMFVLLGCGAICIAVGLRRVGKRATASTV
jgi:hypothetical protein